MNLSGILVLCCYAVMLHTRREIRTRLEMRRDPSSCDTLPPEVGGQVQQNILCGKHNSRRSLVLQRLVLFPRFLLCFCISHKKNEIRKLKKSHEKEFSHSIILFYCRRSERIGFTNRRGCNDSLTQSNTSLTRIHRHEKCV